VNPRIARAALLLAALFETSASSAPVPVTFSVPVASRQILGVPTLSGEAASTASARRFADCDAHDTADGEPVRYKCSTDPNRNSALFSLPSHVLFYDARMGLDRDGSAHARLRKGSDQPDTSFRYPPSRSESLDADRVPYIVTGSFLDAPHRPMLGDVAAVIYTDHLAFAVIGDTGLPYKIGEGSVRLHELLGHEVCMTRTATGDCDAVRDDSIKQSVLYFIFLGTANELQSGLTPQNITERIDALGARRWQQLRQAIGAP
jgi:Fungal chitosanase of glycosyl hydrolase group 75